MLGRKVSKDGPTLASTPASRQARAGSNPGGQVHTYTTACIFFVPFPRNPWMTSLIYLPMDHAGHGGHPPTQLTRQCTHRCGWNPVAILLSPPLVALSYLTQDIFRSHFGTTLARAIRTACEMAGPGPWASCVPWHWLALALLWVTSGRH